MLNRLLPACRFRIGWNAGIITPNLSMACYFPTFRAEIYTLASQYVVEITTFRVAAHWAHNPEVASSNISPATNCFYWS